MSTRPPLTFGLVFPGDAGSPASWSGIPLGLTNGLRAAGVRVEHLSPHLPEAARIAFGATDRVLRRSRAVSHRAPAQVALRTRALAAELDRRTDLDVLILLSTELYEVETTIPTVWFNGMTLAQARRSPHSEASLQGYPPEALAAWARRQARAARSSAVCCLSNPWVAQSVQDDFGVDPSRIHVVGLGADLSPTGVQPSFTVPRFLWVGYEWDRKNGDAVLAAFAQTRARHPAATLDLVGNHPDVDAPGVTGHGILRGAALSAVFDRTTCFLMPSLYEPLGIVFLEAASKGIPSIGGTVGGSAWAIGDGGLVVDPLDPAELQRAMEQMTDPDAAAAFGAAGRRRSGAFTWQKVAERLLRALAPAGLTLDGLEPALDTGGLARRPAG